MKLGLKFGFKMLFRNPVRAVASLLTAIVAFGIAGMCIFAMCYRLLPIERALYFHEDAGKYTNIRMTASPKFADIRSDITTKEDAER